jgi:hypothetical protein
MVQSIAGKYEKVDKFETPEAIAEAKRLEQEVLAVELTPEDLVGSSEPVVKLPPTVKMSDLPPDRQRAIMESLERAKNITKEMKVKTPPKPLQETEKVKAYVPPTDPTESDKSADILADVAGMKKDAKPSDPPTSSGATEPPKTCQHCGWTLDKPDPEDPSDVDKANFIQSILGQIPFRKRYTLLDGQMIIEFRTLDSRESDMVWTQTAYDAQNNEIIEEGHFFRTMIDYRMCLGLSMLKSGKITRTQPDSIEDWEGLEKPPLKATKLKQITNIVYSDILKLESLRRAVALQFFRFQRLVERLECHIDNPDFWRATA